MADGTAAGGPVLDGAGAGDGDAPVLLAVAHGIRELSLGLARGWIHQAPAFVFLTASVKAGRNSNRSPTTP